MVGPSLRSRIWRSLMLCGIGLILFTLLSTGRFSIPPMEQTLPHSASSSTPYTPSAATLASFNLPQVNIMRPAEAQTLEDTDPPPDTFQSAPEASVSRASKAPIMVDGRVLFTVGSIESFSATQRARIANAELEKTLQNTAPEVPIRLNVNTQGDLTTIWLNNRLLLTMTEGDFMVGDDPNAQAEEWVDLLNQAVKTAQRERTPAYQRRAILMCGLMLGLAIALHLAVRWLYRKLRRKIAQRSDDTASWLSHWSVLSLLQPVLSYARPAVWLVSGFYFTGLFPLTRYWRYRLLSFLRTTFTSPAFTLGNQAYSILDFGRAGILIIGLWIIVRAVTALVRSRFLRNVGASREVQDAIALTLQLLLTGIGLIVILSGLGFDLSSLAIFASVLGVGIGFGLQTIANNFMSGLIILFERPIRAGDFVRVGELTGTVERIGARSTEIRTLDLVTIIVPNSELIQTKVVNWSHGHPVSRLHIPFGVAYGTNIREMRLVVLEAVQIHPEVLRYPQPQIRFEDLGDSALNFDVLVWIRDPRQQFRIRSDLLYLLEANFRRHGIEIPFPQQDLHIRWPSGEMPSGVETLLIEGAGNWGSRGAREHEDTGEAAPEAKIQNPKSKVQSPELLLSELLDCSILVRKSGDLSDDELHQLVDEMRQDGGVEVGDRRYGLHVYERCFIGSEAVTWLAKHKKATREEALRIGQSLIERGLMHHVTDEHTFEDEYLFYRFYSDEKRTMNYE